MSETKSEDTSAIRVDNKSGGWLDMRVSSELNSSMIELSIRVGALVGICEVIDAKSVTSELTISGASVDKRDSIELRSLRSELMTKAGAVGTAVGKSDVNDAMSDARELKTPDAIAEISVATELRSSITELKGDDGAEVGI